MCMYVRMYVCMHACMYGTCVCMNPRVRVLRQQTTCVFLLPFHFTLPPPITQAAASSHPIPPPLTYTRPPYPGATPLFHPLIVCACMHVCMHVCMYVCMYACMQHACMHACITVVYLVQPLVVLMPVFEVFLQHPVYLCLERGVIRACV